MAEKTRGSLVGDCARVVAGLFVFSIGAHLTIWANIGLAPWDSLGMGMSYHLPINYGLSMTAMSVVILAIDIALGERIGFGTVIDALATGNFIQVFNDVNPLPENHSLPIGLLAMLVGFAVMAVGMWLYMRAGQGCGPRDSLLVGLGRRVPRVPIGVVEIVLWAAVTLAGWLLGGPVGIGTLVAAFGAGSVMQAVYNVIGFDPRTVTHKSVTETLGLKEPRQG